MQKRRKKWEEDGASSGNNIKTKAENERVEANKNFIANRIILKADTKGAVRFQLEGNATVYRMTKNDNETYTIKAGNRIYGRNVTADRAREIINETQERLRKINNSFKKK